MNIFKYVVIICFLFCVNVALFSNEKTYNGWEPKSVREEVRPNFSFERNTGYQGNDALVISTDNREGLTGFWEKSFKIEGGKYYKFLAFKKLENLTNPNQAVFARILWQKENGKPATWEHDEARAEYPADQNADDDGWIKVEDIYLTPKDAAQAVVELRLRWDKNGKVKWSNISLVPTNEPKPRKVKLAAIHYHPKKGNSILENCNQFVPFIEEAAQKKADLVLMGEVALSNGISSNLVERAEPVPGSATEFFSKLAKQLNIYIVMTIMERDKHLVYNTAALIGPEGYIGKYRKVCLPREEYAKGMFPGKEYPVFQTRFGKVGIMICHDIAFPEVSRQLVMNGAELIVCPIAGGYPLFLSARAKENQVPIVTSTYTSEDDMMKTGIWNSDGELVAHTEDWGTTVVHTIELNKRVYWWWLGDFKNRFKREMPLQ